MSTPITNTNEDIFTAGDGGGILIKKPGTYLVRVKLHIFQYYNSPINVTINRFKTGDIDFLPPDRTIIAPSVSQQNYIEFETIIYNNSYTHDRVVPGIYLTTDIVSGESFVYGTNIANDSMISVTKIA